MATYIKGYIGRDGYISAARPLKIGAAMPLYASGNAISNSGIAAKIAALPLADAWPLAAGLSLLCHAASARIFIFIRHYQRAQSDTPRPLRCSRPCKESLHCSHFSSKGFGSHDIGAKYSRHLRLNQTLEGTLPKRYHVPGHQRRS